MTNEPGLTRREWLKTTAAAAALAVTGSCDPNRPATPSSSTTGDAAEGQNLYDVLKQFSFTDQQGNKTSLENLKDALKGKHVTLSFGFAACEQYCPMINKALASVGAPENRNALAHIIISVNPDDDKDQEARDAFLRRVRGDGVKNPVIILYPKPPEKAPEIAVEAGAIARLDSPLNHSAEIMLYAPGGKPAAHENGQSFGEETAAQWKALMSESREAGRTP